MIQKYKWNFAEVDKFVSSKRFEVNPNPGFRIQLNLLWMQIKDLFVRSKTFKHNLCHDIIKKNRYNKKIQKTFRIKRKSNLNEENIIIKRRIGTFKDMARNKCKAKFISYLLELKNEHCYKTIDEQKKIMREEFSNMGAFVREAFKSDPKLSKEKNYKRNRNITKLLKNNFEKMIEEIFIPTQNDDILNKSK